jgi:hypothetical protein
MEAMYTANATDSYLPSELSLTRSLFMEQDHEGGFLRGAALRNTRKFSCVTHWEEIRCVAIDIKSERLMAVVSLHQTDGYSSVINYQNTSEYIRFFIDWGRGEAYQPAGMVQFEVRDALCGGDPSQLPYQQLVASSFDADRYWDCVLDGIQPKVCAVLSWNLKPPKEVAFRPVFGNVIESRICTESVSDLLTLYEWPERFNRSLKNELTYGLF